MTTARTDESDENNDDNNNNTSPLPVEHLSTRQIQELQGILKNPLTGRQVMIPCTSKAFMIGSLQPKIAKTKGSKNNGEEQQEEILYIRDTTRKKNTSNYDDNTNNEMELLKEMTRSDLSQLLEHEKKQRKQYTPPKDNMNEKKKTKEAAGENNLTGEDTKVEKSVPIPSAPSATTTTSSQTPFQSVNQEATAAAAAAQDKSPQLPFFEIKEELGSDGQVIRSQAIDVSKQLELVSKHANEEKESEPQQDEKSNEENDIIHASRMEVQQNSDRDDNVRDTSASSVGFSTQDDDERHYDYEKSRPMPVTDQEYQSLSARLDQLAKLEEEAEAKAIANKKSAKKLQGSSWSKGFLGVGTTASSSNKQSPMIQKQQQLPPQSHNLNTNNDASPNNINPLSSSTNPLQKQPNETSEAKPVVTTTPVSKAERANSGWSKGFLNASSTSSTKKKAATDRQQQEEIQNLLRDKSRNTVSFRQNVAEVREIPKIGTQSVASWKKRPSFPLSGPPVVNNHINSSGSDDPDNSNSNLITGTTSTRSSTARPFDSSVFSGIVKERPIAGGGGGGGGGSASAAQAPATTTTTTPSSSSATSNKPGGKKLSKFAQQRLENRGGGRSY